MVVVVDVDVGVVVDTLKVELVSIRVDDRPTTAMNRHSPHVQAVWISLKSNKLLQYWQNAPIAAATNWITPAYDEYSQLVSTRNLKMALKSQA